MTSLSRRTALLSAALLLSAAGGGLASVAPGALAATVSTPTFTSASPLGIGATKWTHFTIVGTGFVPGAKVSFFKTAAAITGAAGASSSDVTQDAGTSSTVVTSGTTTTLTAEVTVTATATEGLDVTVTNPDGGAVSCYTPPTTGISLTTDAGCLKIEAAPTGFALPSGYTVGVGATGRAASFTASGLVAGPGMLLSADSPVTLTAPGFAIAAGDKGETASLSVPTRKSDGTANVAGSDKVILVNGDGGRETDGTITVTSPPSLSAISPTTGDAGQLLVLTTTGTFQTTAAPTVTFLGKTYTSTGYSSGTTFTVNLGTVPASTPGGKVAITVTNADGGTDTETNLLGIVGAPAAPPAVTVSGVGDGTATVSFSGVPDNSGGAPVTSYNVTTTPDTGSHFIYVQPGQALSYALTGLTNGTSYTAAVTATNTDSRTNVSQTGPATVSAPFTPTAPAVAPTPGGTLAPTPTVAVPSVSLKSSLKTVNFASPVTISGTALLSGAPIANTSVDLQTISSKGVRSDTGETTTTDASGHFTFEKVYPSYTTTFGVGIANTTTAGIKVVVTQYLLLVNKTLSKTRVYTITGLGTPGTTDKKATVTLFKVTKTGHRVGTITSTVLGKGKSSKGYSAGISTFTLKANLKKGSYLVAVAILGTTTNGPVQSKPFTVKVP